MTLIRRLSFDLTGLPPSLDEVDRFTEDRRPNAYERLVDRMLATPEYGQRWAQHWLDLARFAETDGYEHDKIRETAWQYRDWVIQSLNEDMPYDRFVSLQIAGDLIALMILRQRSLPLSVCLGPTCRTLTRRKSESTSC